MTNDNDDKPQCPFTITECEPIIQVGARYDFARRCWVLERDDEEAGVEGP